MKIYRISALAMLGYSAAFSAQAAVTASLSRNQISSGESVQLVLQRDGRDNSQPDLRPLMRDFNVIGTSSGSSIQIINGSMSSTAEVRIALVPKHDGTVQVPPLQWDGQASPSLALIVGGQAAPTQSASATASDAQHIFFDIQLNTRQGYVQGSMLLTLRMYTDATLYQASLDLVGNSDIKVQQFGEDKQYSQERDGRTYQVVERSYLLFPQRSGQLNLNGPVLNAEIDDPHASDSLNDGAFFDNALAQLPMARMFASKRPFHLQGAPIALNVRARPSAVSAQDWLPAQNLTLQEEWRPANASVHVGDPLTHHLYLHAEGIAAAQLPNLDTLMQLPDGLKAYPDQAQLDTKAVAGRLLVDRDQEIVLIASRPGHYTLPGMRLAWWDTQQNAAKVVELPSRTLDVLPAIGGAGAAVLPSAATTPTALPNAAPATQLLQLQMDLKKTPWLWVSLGMLILWLGTMAVWWRTRQRASVTPNHEPGTVNVADYSASRRTAMRNCQQAARKNDHLATRRYLLVWARAMWPQDPPTGLTALAGRLHQPLFNKLLQDLDRACYAGGMWQGAPLAQAIKAWHGVDKTPGNKDEIADMYV